jgi:hypothetical protein
MGVFSSDHPFFFCSFLMNHFLKAMKWMLTIFFVCFVSQNGDKLKTTDSDLYIDDEGDDEIQLQDEASGSGPAKPGK